MARIFYDNDADTKALNGKRITVVGYGNQGRAQSLNLRDSGFPVTVGNIDDDYRKRAVEEGFTVKPIEEAVVGADIVLILIPDEVQPAVYGERIAPHVKDGVTLCFASGYNIHYELIAPRPGDDIIMVAPRMIGKAVRELFEKGDGYPCLVAVAQDASGKGWPITLGIAKAIGATRVGAFASSFREETVIDLFAEQMLWPGINKLCMLYFDKLVEQGCDPEIVAMELHLSGEFVEIARAMISEGFFKQLRLHSHTSQYGQLTRADRMAPEALLGEIDKAMDEIQSGAFAKEWTAEQAQGLPKLHALWEEVLEHPMNAAEARLERLRHLAH